MPKIKQVYDDNIDALVNQVSLWLDLKKEGKLKKNSKDVLKEIYTVVMTKAVLMAAAVVKISGTDREKFLTGQSDILNKGIRNLLEEWNEKD